METIEEIEPVFCSECRFFEVETKYRCLELGKGLVAIDQEEKCLTRAKVIGITYKGEEKEYAAPIERNAKNDCEFFIKKQKNFLEGDLFNGLMAVKS